MMNDFSARLIRWYNAHKRDLPWRKTHDPYLIWISEIMLQQTRVEQGLDYYLRFTSRFPNVRALAKAPIDEVLKLWEGLGYYSRARNLHETSKTIVDKYKGIFPGNFDEIIALKGIGEYTASAISSFAFNQPTPVMDGNVLRVLARIKGIKKDILSSSVKQEIYQQLEQWIDRKNPGIFNQAIMEFGALHCKPQNPDCNKCVFKKDCVAFKKQCVGSIPFKATQTKIKERYFNYLLIHVHVKKEGFIPVHKRTGNDIWKGLYELPLIETKQHNSLKKLYQSREWKALFKGVNFEIAKESEMIFHQLSHRTLHTRFIEVNTDKFINETKYELIKLKKLKSLAFPVLISKYLNKDQK
jgi:A/G-specific adenine glycosylase